MYRERRIQDLVCSDETFLQTLCRNIIKSSEEFSILIKSIVQEEAKEARGKEGAEGFSPQKKPSLKASNVPTFMDIAY
jgi:hypothetical protein